MNLTAAEEYIIRRLKSELPATMYYHTLEHTLDVRKVANQLIKEENIDQQTGLIIETAALFHDSGMMRTYKDHELASVDIVKSVLPQFSYSQPEISEISDSIMATVLPQKPETYAGKILCDADMDNLGRTDFLVQSFRLKLEMEMNGIGTFTLKNWLKRLVQFLDDHVYHTATAIKLRQTQKLQNISELREVVMLF